MKTRVIRATLLDLQKMKDRGDLFHDPAAPEGKSLGARFWVKATLELPPLKTAATLDETPIEIPLQ